MNLKKYITLLLTAIITIISRYGYAQSQPGFVQQENIKIPFIINDAQIYPLNTTQKQTTRSFYDGLGRTIQSIGVKASPAGNDMIQPAAYDNLGRQTTAYLPYAGLSTDSMGSFRSNAISSAQPAFYNQTSQYLIPVDGAPYAQKVFENTPLQRMLEAGMVGTGFQPVTGQKFKTVSYRSNTTADGNILVWNPDGTYTTGSYYAVSSLSVTDGKDEDNAETLTFTDLEGHTILKRQILTGGNLDTYYIYNNGGMVAYIIPPKAMALMNTAGSYNISTVTGVSALVFIFTYDNMGRVIEKTVPAKGKIVIVYDQFNRPYLIQDANMALTNTWNYIKYDTKSRPITQGIYVDNITTPTSHIGRPNMQAYVNSLNYLKWYETRTSTLTKGGYYTNIMFPTGAVTGTSLTPLAYAYYDDYFMTQGGTADFSYQTQSDAHLPGEETATTAQLKGMPTIVTQTTVGAGIAANTWLTTVTFYDHNLHPIQVQSNNHIYHTGYITQADLTDTKTVVPDFLGMPLYSKISKKTTATVTTTVYTSMAYDPMYRVQNVSQIYNTGSYAQVAAYSYNELGEVIKKGLGYVSSTAWLQNVNFRYSIRGQLLNINNSKLVDDGGVTSNETNDLFGMQMLYDQKDLSLNNNPCYNGMLSAVKWMSKDASGNKSYERAFNYYYDGLNRDTAAVYNERPSTALITTPFTNTNGWNEDRITYDQNGNLLTLFRDAATQGAGNHVPIDNLTYTYSTTNPNQLLTVSDATGNSAGFVGGAGGSYTYDANGNQMNDAYKGLTFGAYNVLNRTDKITISTGNYVDYTYDAGGNLIRKRQYTGGTINTTTDYLDGFVYITASTGAAVLSYMPMPEGRVLYNNSTSTFSQEFIITDQQGNARISFNNAGTGGTAKVVQENSYYAFGLIMPGSAVGTTGTDNKQLYNGGSEWQNDYQNLPDYYQTFNRNYDAALARWIGVDPDAEGAESMSSYHYAGNNPIMFNDPLGDANQINPVHWAPPNVYCTGCGDVGGGAPDAQSVQEWADNQNSAANQQYSADLQGDNGIDAQNAAIAARNQAGQTAGATPMGLAAQLNTAIQPYAANLSGVSLSNDGSGSYTVNIQTSFTYTDPVATTGYGVDINNRSVNINNQGGDSGPLSAPSLLAHYLGWSGTNYNLSTSTFNAFLMTMKASGELNKIKNKGIPVPNVKGLYQVTVNTYGTSYENAVGLATLYYNDTGFVGYSDWWNFDPRAWGKRSKTGEVLTRLGNALPGAPFMVLYGITPPVNTIPRN